MKERKEDKKEGKQKKRKNYRLLMEICKQHENREEISADMIVVCDFQTLALFLV